MEFNFGESKCKNILYNPDNKFDQMFIMGSPKDLYCVDLDKKTSEKVFTFENGDITVMKMIQNKYIIAGGNFKHIFLLKFSKTHKKIIFDQLDKMVLDSYTTNDIVVSDD